MYFIILATAATLHQAGRTDINSAADAVKGAPLCGDAATWLMAIGLIGTGFGRPILTASAAYALCEIFGWPCSLDATPRQAKEFYLTIAPAHSERWALISSVSIRGCPPLDGSHQWTARTPSPGLNHAHGE